MPHLAPPSAPALPPVTAPVPMPGPIAGTMLIPLHGKHGRGLFATLDDADYQRVEREWGGEWIVVPNGCGKSYVTTCRHSLRALADQPGSGCTSRLGRLLVGACRGDIVVFADGNPLNLRRENLTRMNRAAAARWRKAQALGATVH